MSTLTSEYWEVDGVPLHTFAHSVENVSGNWTAPTRFRGENRKVAYRAGAMHRPKPADQKIESLAMWVSDRDADNQLSGGNTPHTQFNQNWLALRRLLWRDDGEQFVLTKRWESSPGVWITASALAEFHSGLEPRQIGRNAGRFAVDLLLADPYYYGQQQMTLVPLNTPTVITNDGDVILRKIGLTFNGELGNPTLTNGTPEPEVWVKVGSQIAAGDAISLDVMDYTAVRASDSANLIGAVTHSGARQWMALATGSNTLTLTADSGDGTCQVDYTPAYH